MVQVYARGGESVGIISRLLLRKTLARGQVRWSSILPRAEESGTLLRPVARQLMADDTKWSRHATSSAAQKFLGMNYERALFAILTRLKFGAPEVFFFDGGVAS
jgi:hypothetical protein